jgi:hypothetical protein
MSSEWVYVKPPHRHEFFGEVKHRLVSPSEREVEMVVKPDESLGFELAIAAMALDGSKSMLRTYAAALPKMIRRKQNKVHPIAQELASFLAKNSRNQCAIAYWACGDDGSEIEPVGIMGTSEIQAYEFAGAQRWGGGTKLTPIVQYFWEQVFVGADKVGMAVILTDGAWDDDDHDRLLELTQTICQEVAAERRHLMKCVVLGLKTEDNKGEADRIAARFNALDNYESGTDVDVWYTNWVDELEDWIDLFIELVKDWSLGVGGFVEVQGQKVVQQDEFNFGMQFNAPAGANSFTIHLDGIGDYTQEIG